MNEHPIVDEHNLLSILAIGCAVAAATILIVYLVRRPPLVASTKIWLGLGLGALPIGAALSANVQGYKATQHRAFCGSCHVMVPHAEDSEDPKSVSLAAIHARNPFFGKDNCYTCHADYGIFGTFFTKLGGMRHVWLYATEFHSMDLAEAKEKIHLLKPYPNQNCMQCHTTDAPLWNRIPDHASARQEVVDNRIGCSSPGCHGVAHPRTKTDPAIASATPMWPARTAGSAPWIPPGRARPPAEPDAGVSP